MIRRLAILALAALLAPAAAAAQAPTVVILVRHAEKAAAPADDPPLTAAGVARARALAAGVADAKVQAVITTQLTRTRETARPAAEAHRVTMETVSVGGAPVAEHANAVAAAVRRHAGQTVLVVGHSNTVARIIEALGGPSLPDLCDSQYSTLFTLALDGPSARLVTSEYGAPSPAVKTGCPAMR
ncbi:MAG: histidine phosphatase family protein [Gemmatimonadota bacterium]|nr:histidine phosphatase family protein [Gemmatimonadota bacterium]